MNTETADVRFGGAQATQTPQGLGRNGTANAQLPVLFGVTILSSACLLFLVQPLISKLILPWFGGSAAVWITCMLFFQAGLLLGYLYAHGLTRALGPKRQGLLHMALLLASLAALPILPNARWEPQPGEDPTWRVFGVLTASVGLPYVLLSSTTPLLQAWYTRTSEALLSYRPLPYRYFALSNGGSLAALLAYPMLIEPYLTGHQQAWMWSIAYVIFMLLCISTAIAGMRGGDVGEQLRRDTPVQNGYSKIRVFFWIALAACASTLLLAVTNLLTQNIAPMPLLWVLPLSIYLLTFILAFESDRWYRRFVFLPLVLPALGCLAAAAGPLNTGVIAVEVPVLCAALFICCMACHGELARLKPDGSRLTTFYLCLSVGGAAGGLFVAVFAPHVFHAMYEYPVAFVFCPVLLLFVLWREHAQWSKRNAGLSIWLAALAGTLVLMAYVARQTWRDNKWAKLEVRNFYGALRVDDFVDHNHWVRELSHGTIIHGIQFLAPRMRNQPTTYYARDSGIGLTWRALEPAGPLRMGVIGLGAGTLAAYGRGGDTLRFYDINPEVVRIARTEFTFLPDCPAHIDVVLGDARLSLEREPAQQFDILVIDAFSGDAIPIHLLTREAFRLYWRHLKPNGVLAVHISNRYLNLAPVVSMPAAEAGKQAWYVESDDNDAQEVYSSSYVLVTSRPKFFQNALFKGQLSKISVPPHFRTWADDYSNLWKILTFK